MAALALKRVTPSRFTFAYEARRVYSEKIRDGSIEEASTQGGRGIPLDVLAQMQERAPEGDVTEYYTLELGGRLTHAAITHGRGGEIIRVFSATGQLLARGVYPVDEDGRASGDVLWR